MKLNKKGFTLVELMVVIVIIGILAAIIIPNVAKNIEKANQTKALSEGKSAYSELIGILDLGTYTMSETFIYYDEGQKMRVIFDNGSADLNDMDSDIVTFSADLKEYNKLNDTSTKIKFEAGDTVCIKDSTGNHFYYVEKVDETTIFWLKWNQENNKWE